MLLFIYSHECFVWTFVVTRLTVVFSRRALNCNNSHTNTERSHRWSYNLSMWVLSLSAYQAWLRTAALSISTRRCSNSSPASSGRCILLQQQLCSRYSWVPRLQVRWRPSPWPWWRSAASDTEAVLAGSAARRVPASWQRPTWDPARTRRQSDRPSVNTPTLRRIQRAVACAESCREQTASSEVCRRWIAQRTLTTCTVDDNSHTETDQFQARLVQSVLHTWLYTTQSSVVSSTRSSAVAVIADRTENDDVRYNYRTNCCLE